MRRLGCRDGPNRSLRRTLWRRRLRRRLNRSLGWRPQRLRLRSYDLSGTFRLGLLRLDRDSSAGLRCPLLADLVLRVLRLGGVRADHRARRPLCGRRHGPLSFFGGHHALARELAGLGSGGNSRPPMIFRREECFVGAGDTLVLQLRGERSDALRPLLHGSDVPWSYRYRR